VEAGICACLCPGLCVHSSSSSESTSKSRMRMRPPPARHYAAPSRMLPCSVALAHPLPLPPVPIPSHLDPLAATIVATVGAHRPLPKECSRALRSEQKPPGSCFSVGQRTTTRGLLAYLHRMDGYETNARAPEVWSHPVTAAPERPRRLPGNRLSEDA
jgi:hypothetical protein